MSTPHPPTDPSSVSGAPPDGHAAEPTGVRHRTERDAGGRVWRFVYDPAAQDPQAAPETVRVRCTTGTARTMLVVHRDWLGWPRQQLLGELEAALRAARAPAAGQGAAAGHAANDRAVARRRLLRDVRGASWNCVYDPSAPALTDAPERVRVRCAAGRDRLELHLDPAWHRLGDRQLAALIEQALDAREAVSDEARRGEPRWPAVIAVLAAGSVHYALPSSMSAGPPWLLLVVAGLLVVPTIVTHRLGQHDLNGVLGHVVTGVVSAGLVWAIARLVMVLSTHGPHAESAKDLLRAAALLWVTTVLVFASWYWRLDAGGPNERDARRHAGEPHTRGAFLFPQMTIDPESLRPQCDVEAHWSPQFIDYLFVAFTASTAFSPTDVPVLSRWAKALMMLQAVLSLTTIALVAARAVNIL